MQIFYRRDLITIQPKFLQLWTPRRRRMNIGWKMMDTIRTFPSLLSCWSCSGVGITAATEEDTILPFLKDSDCTGTSASTFGTQVLNWIFSPISHWSLPTHYSLLKLLLVYAPDKFRKFGQRSRPSNSWNPLNINSISTILSRFVSPVAAVYKS